MGEWLSYDGDWVIGNQQGMGAMRLPNGDCYDGEFFNNMRHGKGIYRLANGASYEGDYMDGLEHGRGLRKWTRVEEVDYLVTEITLKGIFSRAE